MLNVMQIEVVYSPLLYPVRSLQTNHVTVAVDILRATTALCAAFQAGADEVVPLDSLDPLPDYHRRGYTVAAERGGKKLPLAEVGNSPTEYLMMDLRGRRLAYSTTNGTVAILTARGSDEVLVGCFSNLSTLADRLCRQERDVVVLCSGWKNDPSLEDSIFAGALVEKLCVRKEAQTVNDAALMCRRMWQTAADDPYRFCLEATHVHRLCSMGAEADIRYAFRIDTCRLVPRLDADGVLRLIDNNEVI